MLPNTNSDPAATPAEQPTPQATPAADPSSEEVKITKKEWTRVQSALGRVENLQRENAELKKGQIPQKQDDLRPLLERAHSLGAQNKSLDEAINLIQGEQTDQQFRDNVNLIAQAIRSGGALPAGPGTTSGVDLAPVLSAYKLDPKDPYVAAKLSGKQFKDATEAELYVGQIFRDKTLAPNPNQAQQPTTPASSVPAPSMTPEEIEQKSIHLNRLYDNYTANEKEIKVLEGELNAHWEAQKTK